MIIVSEGIKEQKKSGKRKGGRGKKKADAFSGWSFH